MGLEGEREPELGAQVVGQGHDQRMAPGAARHAGERPRNQRSAVRKDSAGARRHAGPRTLRHLQAPGSRTSCARPFFRYLFGSGGMTLPYPAVGTLHLSRKIASREYLTRRGWYNPCMSYQVLARKWRPRNFESLVG